MYTLTLEKLGAICCLHNYREELKSLAPPRPPQLPLCALFHFVGIVSFVNTTLVKFEFQCQVRLSQVNVVFQISLRFKNYAIRIE